VENDSTTIPDHFLVGTSDLHAAAADFGRTTGVEPVFGGEHPLWGTANYLVSLGQGSYLELIGPTPGKKPHALGVALRDFEAPTLFWFAARAKWIDDAPAVFQKLGLRANPPASGTRATPGGDAISWRLADVTGHAYGGCIPFLIDWQDSTHPSESIAQSLQFARFEISHPEAAELNAVFARIGLSVVVSQGDPQLSLGLVGPRGELELTGSGSMPWFAQTRSGVFPATGS